MTATIKDPKARMIEIRPTVEFDMNSCSFAGALFSESVLEIL
jgi:hypothetical protein